MFKRLRKVLVESFVGAIALGWMLAEIVAHLVNAFAAPVAAWLARTEYKHVITAYDGPKGFIFQDALPELARFAILLLVWYVLVRWLYFTPVEKEGPKATENPEQPTRIIAE